MSTQQDLFMEAARILTVDGWRQGALGPDCGPNCASGALARAAKCHPDDENRTIYGGTRYYYARCYFEGFIGARMVSWNDAPERTAEDVILAFKRAAEES